ncbi:uncharacterized protein LOC116030839 isoform X4 [Ipomoea triloba]|uniref:uncharacterized protein LOC116030839 isoform X4 n=1 Tax=Ipomoea triloba TaxID=35885 RepID=UPI00125D9974|nr:uncharacterized protein LOC116030839 isoform X4 [Ipomoea triloba]
MANKSPRYSLQYKKDQAGCIWGFINIFDFRNGRSTRKLLADGRQASGQVGASSSMKLKIPNPSEKSFKVKIQDDDESEAATLDSKTSVKELMEEEMFGEASPKDQRNDVEIQPEAFNSHKGSHTKRRKCKRTFRTSDRSRSMSLSDLDDVKNVGSDVSCRQVLNSDDFQIIMEELGQIHVKTNSFRKKDVRNKQSDQDRPVLEEKLSAAIEMLVNQKSKDSRHFEEDETAYNSQELMDALQTLSSNKELCWKLLQDPNSRLVNHMESLEDRVEKGRKSNSRLKSNLMQKNVVHAKTDAIGNSKRGHFFRRRSKSQESYPLMEDERSRPSSKIVILKPGPAGLQFPGSPIDVSSSVHSPHTMGNKLQNGKSSSHFSFTEIKRRLKKAMGKECQGISHEEIVHKKHSDIDKGISGENIGWSSPNRNHFYTERFARPSPIHFKRGDKKGKPKDIEEATINEASNYPKLEISNIYLEAKKHLLEMLDNGEKEEELISEKLPKSLGRILSLPEYNTSSNCSPRKCTHEDVLPPRMRVAPSDSNLERQSSAAEINSEQYIKLANGNLDIPCELNCDDLLEKIVSPTKDEVAVAGVLDTEEPAPIGYQEDGKVLDASCKPISFSITIDIGSADVTEAFNTETSSPSLKLASECLSDSYGAKEVFSCWSAVPLNSSDSGKVEYPQSVMDRMEQPSPVSVLEPLFPENDINPATTMCQPVELEIQPQKIDFEEPAATSLDQQLYTLTFLENEESAFEYVEAVLLGSGLNWDEFLLSWLSSDQILDPSLFDEVDLLSECSCRKLLFDCTNEVLTEACDRYFGCFPGTPFVKQNIRPVPKGMDLINEVWIGIEWYLLNTPPPHSLDQLVEKDMERPAGWMDLKSDVKDIGNTIEAAIFEELMEETLLSFANDTSEGNPIPLSESEIEISIN